MKPATEKRGGATKLRGMNARALGVTTLAISAALPLVVLATILQLGINQPFKDEWIWTDFIYHLHNGTLTPAELWQPHNEHRIITANVVMLVLAQFGGWDTVREQCFSLVMFAASQIVLWQLLRRTVSTVWLPPALLAVSVALYSMGQVENYLYGFQIGWPICTFGLALATLLLSAPERGRREVALAGTVATLASYSSSQGLLIWAVGALLLFFGPRRSMAQLALWIGWGTVVTAFDRIGIPGNAPHAAMSDVAGLTTFVLVYLGAPLAGWAGLNACVITGAFTLGAFITAVGMDVRRGDPSGLALRLPWYGLGVYATLGAAATAYARLQNGIGAALAPRYVSVASMLDVALIVALFTYAAATRRVALRTAALAAVAGMTLTAVPATLNGLSYWAWYDNARARDLDAIRSGNMAALDDTYPNATELARYIAELREIHDGPFRRSAAGDLR